MSIKTVSSIQKSDTLIVEDVVLCFLHDAVLFHVAHLQETDHAAHVVLKDVYEFATNAADRLFEEQKGRGLPLNLSSHSPMSVSVELGASPSYTLSCVDTTLQFLQSAARTVSDLQLSSTLDDLTGQLYRLRYQLSLTRAAN